MTETNKYVYSAKDKVLMSIFRIDLVGNIMKPNDALHQEQCLVSENSAYFLKMQKDGNLVLYCSSHFHHTNSTWSSKSHNKAKGPFKLIFHQDGTMEVLSSNSQIWKSKLENNGKAPFYLKLQNDGNLVVYDKDEKAVWSTGTYLTD